MDSTVAPVAAAEAPFDATEESVIQDPATRQTIEQLIVACFSDIGKALAAAGVAKRDTLKAKDGEDDTDEEDCVDGEDTVSLETLEEEWRRVVQPLKTRLFNDLNAIEVDLIREVFYHDRMILEAAQYYGIKPEERIKILSDKKVQFVVLGNKYEEWLAQHFKTISTRFVVHRTHEHILGVFKGQTRFTYNCHRAGKHRAQPTRVPGGASGKPRNRPASIKMNCTSQFTRMMVPKEDGLEDAATFEYNYLHNHELGATTELEKWEVANMVRLTIRSLCNMKGSIVSRVLRQLVMQFDDIGGLLKGGEQSSQGLNDDVVDCNDVYNIWYSTATETMFKDPDATLSAVKWMKALDKEQAFTYHQPSYQSGCLYFGFASRWQMQQLHDYGETLFFEGRPFAFGHNISLFSLVLKHPSTGTAIPVAFLLSKTSDAQILEDWFGAIRARMRQIYSTPDAEYDYNPAIVITNQGAMAVQVLKVAFSGVSIHYSGWHLTRLWEKDLASKLTGMEGLTAKQRRDFDAKVQAGLHTILYEMDETKAAERITQFRNKWRRQEQLLAYLNSHFFGPDRRTVQDHQTESQQEEMVQQIQDRQKRWMLCYRPDVTPANASSYKDIAPWLDSLERKCFTATPQQQHRFDTVIFILTTIAVPYFQQQCLDRMLDSDTVKAAVAAAENEKEKKGGETWLDRCAKFHLDTRESRGYSERTISLASEMSLKIESFTQPGVSYEVKMEAIKNPSARGGHYVFCRCSCPVATRDGIVDCHHIALVRIRIPQRTFGGGPPPPLPEPVLEPTPETTEPAIIVVVNSPPNQDQVQDHDCEHWNQKDDFEEVVEQDSEVAVHEDEVTEAVVEEATDMVDEESRRSPSPTPQQSTTLTTSAGSAPSATTPPLSAAELELARDVTRTRTRTRNKPSTFVTGRTTRSMAAAASVLEDMTSLATSGSTPNSVTKAPSQSLPPPLPPTTITTTPLTASTTATETKKPFDLDFYLNRLNQLNAVRDRNKEVPQSDMLQTLFEYAIHMIEPSKPRTMECRIEEQEEGREGREREQDDDSTGQGHKRPRLK